MFISLRTSQSLQRTKPRVGLCRFIENNLGSQTLHGFRGSIVLILKDDVS